MGRITINLIFAVMLLSAIAFSPTAYAGSWNAGKLKTFCEANDASQEKLVCLGYFIGFSDASEFGGKICILRGSPAQFIRLFLKHVRDKPARLRVPASLVVSQVLANAYPCK